MARFRHLLVLGKLDSDRRRSLGAMATASKLELANEETTDGALVWLERNDPALVAFDTTVARAEKLCEKVRGKKPLAGVPLIALTADAGDVFVEKLYAMGADDVIPLERGAALLARLKARPPGVPVGAVASRGKAVVCDKDRSRCDVYGRVLSNAGYDVKNALDDVALKYFAQQKDVAVVVLSAEVTPARLAIEHARKLGSEAVWVITAPRRDIEKLRLELADVSGVAVLGAALPAESVLFTSNELRSGADRAARRSARVLYGTTVWFRAAGEDEDELGFSYNVSAGGLFVRTLLPPSREEVWLELRPPRNMRRVRLTGRVAWRRGFDLASAAAAPPGFGVELGAGLGDGHEQWLDGYATLIDEPRISVPGPPPMLTPLSPAPVQIIAPAVVLEPLDEADIVSAAGSDDGQEQEPALEALAPPISTRPSSVPPPMPATPAPSPVAPEAIVAPAPPVTLGAAALAEPMPPDEPAPRPQPIAPTAQPGSSGRWVAIGVGLAVLLAVGLFAWERMGPGRPALAPLPVSVSPRASAAEEPSATADRSAVSPVVAADAADATDASPAAEAGPAVAVGPADGGEEGSDDGASLNSTLGYLIVESSRSEDVYATGFKVGKTNARNVSKCGLRYVRLGRGEPPSWIGEGLTVDVKCRAVTTIKLDP